MRRGRRRQELRRGIFTPHPCLPTGGLAPAYRQAGSRSMGEGNMGETPP